MNVSKFTAHELYINFHTIWIMLQKKKNIFNKSMNISRNVQRWGKKCLLAHLCSTQLAP